MSSSEEEIIFNNTNRNSTTMGADGAIVSDGDGQCSGEIENNIVLSLIYKNGKLGAAFYNFQERVLNVYEEMLDLSPHYFKCRTLYRQLSPKHTVIVGDMNEEVVKVMIDMIKSDDVTLSSNSARTLPPNLYLVAPKDYTYEMCMNAVSHLTLGVNCMEDSDAKKVLVVQSLINFDNKMSTHALGALVKYLDKNRATFGFTKEDMQFLYINQVSLKNHVFMDCSVFLSLQIFAIRNHDAGFKRGLASCDHEGFSVFKLFSTFCKSPLGLISLKFILLNPIYDIHELNKRLNYIDFVLDSAHSDFVESLEENFKKLFDIHKILVRIQNSRATRRNWKILHKTVSHMIHINELSSVYQNECLLLNDLNEEVTKDLLVLQASLNAALDLDDSNDINNRQVIKFGVDSALDAKKLRLRDMAKHVTAAARITVEQLPNYLDQCQIVYLPEMGHLVSINEWDDECDLTDLQELNFEYMFTVRKALHFKNPICKGGPHSHAKILTGPNGSGKSVYLKQVALNVYLAHVGSYIPARKANIAMISSFHTRVQATESASVRLSAFMVDIIQATQALHNATANSLLLLDEFGRGTTGHEGLALLCGIIKYFLQRGELCPHILVSTHFLQIIQRLPETNMVEHCSMAHRLADDENLMFLFKVVKGVSEAFAIDLASELGLDDNVVNRAREFLNHLKYGTAITPLRRIAEVDFTTVVVPEVDDDPEVEED